MDSFYAPYMQGNDALFEGISRMAAIKSAALVVKVETKHRLFTSKTVFEGYATKKMDTCAHLWNEEGFQIEDMNDFDLGPLITLPLGKPRNLTDLLEDILKRKKMDYGFLYPEREPHLVQLVQVVTRREERKFAIVGNNTICVCDSTDRHLTYDPNKDGKPCDFDPPHKYKCTSSK
ncbi:hypothetical protein D3H65_06105 [Paraflavitalea soli]|uniref:Uncharacterized protein n=1 Tax=Paraflavitalea soli TaxID=2315862 RepID=A0A3B7MH90_9BACT|nr:hypothetical protein [Paraflavitalea soli]AXY73578.1 hypothetical protein D3H65_06105 [Paraflavitalea soli]